VTRGDLLGSVFTQHSRQRNLVCGLFMVNPSTHPQVYLTREESIGQRLFWQGSVTITDIYGMTSRRLFTTEVLIFSLADVLGLHARTFRRAFQNIPALKGGLRRQRLPPPLSTQLTSVASTSRSMCFPSVQRLAAWIRSGILNVEEETNVG
jgi:hypothetical protein